MNSPPKTEKDFEQRLVLDQRRPNCAWRTPPSSPMGSPALFPFVEVPRQPKKTTQAMVGDLPNFYWSLGLESGMEEHFCLPDVAPRDLALELWRSHQVEIVFPSETVGFGLACPAMGWSWAVVLAHMCLEDILATQVAGFTASTRLSYRLLIPQLVDSAADPPLVHWEFIDDVGALVVTDQEEEDAPSEYRGASATAEAVRVGLSEVGLGLHKVEVGGEVKSLGHEIAPEDFGVRAARGRLWELMDLTDEILRIGRTYARAVEVVVSTWCWLQMCQRSALSVWSAVYGFIEKH